jgi:hypothetical protein
MKDKQVKNPCPTNKEPEENHPRRAFSTTSNHDRPEPVVPSSPYGVDMQQNKKKKEKQFQMQRGSKQSWVKG